MNFVALCNTRSAPKLSGRWPSGVAKVLSTTTSAPVPWPNRHSSGRSATSISGLVGDSSHSRSAAQAACLVAAVSVMSTVAHLPPAVRRAVGQQRPHPGVGVGSAPPHARRSAPGRESPPPHPSRTRTTTAVPPSSAPTASSSACQLAVPPSREYSVTGASAVPARKFEASTSGTFIGGPGRRRPAGGDRHGFGSECARLTIPLSLGP